MCFCWLRNEILALTLLCLISNYSNVVLFNFTKNCMIERSENHTGWMEPIFVRNRRSINASKSDNEFTKEPPIEMEETELKSKCNESDILCFGGLQKSGERKIPVPEYENIDSPLLMTYNNVTTPSKCPISFDLSELQESTLLSAPAWGALVAIFPSTWLTHRFGARKIFTIFGLMSAIITSLPPFVIWIHGSFEQFIVFLAIRILQGISLGACLPVIAVVTTFWAPIKEYYFFLTILSCFIQIAPFLAYPIGGIFCGCDILSGWPMTNWIFSLLTLFLFSIWAVFYRDLPQKHPWHTGHELYKIIKGKSAKRRQLSVPLKALIKSVSFWAIIVAAFASTFSIQMIIIYTPTFIKYVIKFESVQSGLTAALPTIVMLFVKFLAGFCSENIKIRNETFKIRIFNSIALFGMSAFLVILSFLPQSPDNLTIGILICATALLGFNIGGFYKSAVLIARQYCVFIVACIQTFMLIAIAVEPFLVTALVSFDQRQSHAKWSIVFLIHSTMLVVCGIIFVFLAKGEEDKWAQTNGQNHDDNDNQSIEAGILEMNVIPVEPKS